MNTELFNALDALEKEKGIPKDYMLERLEAALVSAFKRSYGTSNVRVVLDPEKKDCKVYQQKTVVETVENPDTEISLEDAKKISRRYTLDAVVEFEIKTKSFGRTAALAAKQVIVQGIREAERGMLQTEYENKKENIVTATVLAVDEYSGNVIVDTGTSEATLLRSEQIPGERFDVGDHIKVFITEVSREQKGRLVTLSRTHPGLVKRLFELEVPEITDGVVMIKSIAREAGSRTKMAVTSRDEAVDPIGACIGNRGSRISAIVSELCGEKIDVIRFSEEPEAFIKAALAPANVRSVLIETATGKDGKEEKIACVTVAPEQLSLAIGKEGQNARLAARLTGYKIDIRAE